MNGTTTIRAAAVLAGFAVVAGTAVGVADAATPTAAAPACTGSQLSTSIGASQGGLGHIGVPLVFRNTSKHACSLMGYPGLDALAKNGSVVTHAKRTPSGYLAGAPTGRTVTVQPGHYASAFAEWEDMSSNGRACPTAHSIAVTAPNTTRTVRRAVRVGRCDLQVHPVTAGRSGTYQAVSHYTAARRAWIHASKVSAAQQNVYLDRAARDLDSAKRDYSRQARQLRDLAALPLTSETKAQMREAHRLVDALDSFFHTPKLFR